MDGDGFLIFISLLLVFFFGVCFGGCWNNISKENYINHFNTCTKEHPVEVIHVETDDWVCTGGAWKKL